jgi:hypothetical protein
MGNPYPTDCHSCRLAFGGVNSGNFGHSLVLARTSAGRGISPRYFEKWAIRCGGTSSSRRRSSRSKRYAENTTCASGAKRR